MSPRLHRLLVLLRLLAARAAGSGPAYRSAQCWNAMFDRSQLSTLAHERRALEVFDALLFADVNSAYYMGQMLFEYGMLANFQREWRGLRVLDIGTGDSSFALWMASQGAEVTSLEAENQAEVAARSLYTRVSRRLSRGRHLRIRAVTGDMRSIPLPADSFDLVTSISVVEHLDTEFPSLRYVPYAEQKRRLSETLSEMIRVTKPGGHLYVTSECADFERATSDSFEGHYFRGGPTGQEITEKFSSVWRVEDVVPLFYDFVRANGCSLPGGLCFRPEELDASDRRATFRGPYFTSFAMLARKDSGHAS
jgi:SAM-dependent methyltransferase